MNHDTIQKLKKASKKSSQNKSKEDFKMYSSEDGWWMEEG
jgi:hypothetical protein